MHWYRVVVARPSRKSSLLSGVLLRLISVVWVLLPPRVVLADYEVPNPAYAAPANYYASASGTGAALRMSLHGIVTSGFVARSYGDARYAFAFIDADPSHPGNIRLIYNSASVPSTWDSGITYNREHLFCQSWLGISVSNSYKGPGSDLFELRPCNPNINSSRGNDPYGLVTSSGAYGHVSGSWYPSDADAGDVARTLFYMGTRYYDGSGVPSINNLDVINGSWQLYRAADLNSLLHWNYKHGVDNFERRRNHYIYSSALNPYYQGNRNPYIDHPEYVWAAFGGGNNNSTIYLGSSAPADGASAVAVDLGRVIRGGPLGTADVTIHKNGANPTTYDIVTSGDAATAAVGTGQPFNYDNQTRTISVGLNASSTATPGLRTGTVTIDNTDLTSAGPGMGSADGNDTLAISASVLEHAKPSFSADSAKDTLIIDFGIVAPHSGQHREGFRLTNLEAVTAYTAALNLDSINVQGDNGVLSAPVLPFSHLAAGDGISYTALLNTDTSGAFAVTYRLSFSDENLPGEAVLGTMTLTLQAHVPQLGDVDHNGVIDAHDIDALVAAMGTDDAFADLNSSLVVDEQDKGILVREVLGTEYGDANLDGAIDVSDLLVMASNWGQAGGWAEGDFTGDGIVNVVDLLLLADNW